MQLQNHKPVTGIPKWYDKVPYLDELSLIYPFSVDHEIAGRGPKVYSKQFKELLATFGTFLAGYCQ